MIHLKNGKLSASVELRTDSQGDICLYMEDIMIAYIDSENGSIVFIPISPKHSEKLALANVELNEIECEHLKTTLYAKHSIVSHNFRCSFGCGSNKNPVENIINKSHKKGATVKSVDTKKTLSAKPGNEIDNSGEMHSENGEG